MLPGPTDIRSLSQFAISAPREVLHLNQCQGVVVFGHVPLRKPARRSRPTGTSAWLIASAVSVLFGLVLLVFAPRDAKRWAIPVALATPLILIDVVRWIRRECDVFDPAALFALLGVQHFVLLPIFLTYSSAWPSFLPPVDWGAGLTKLAWLNLFGLLLYRLSVRSSSLQRLPKPQAFPPLPRPVKNGAQLGLAIALLFQGVLWSRFGGLGGYLVGIDNRRSGTLDGLGPLLSIAETVPFFLTLLYVCRRQKTGISRLELLLFFCVLFLVTILSSGLRGSRSNVIWTIMIAAVLVHRYLRRISRGLIIVSLAAALLFSYGYGFYKALGSPLVSDVSSQSRAELEEQTGRSLETILVADVGKTRIQTWVAGRLVTSAGSFEVARGETYFSAFALPIRQYVDVSHFRTKNDAAIELRLGPNPPDDARNSQVFGLAGEAMLNFGPIGVVFAYGLLGLMMIWLRHKYATGSVVTAPIAAIMGIALLNSDFDNVVFIVVKHAAFPALIIGMANAVHRGVFVRKMFRRAPQVKKVW